MSNKDIFDAHFGRVVDSLKNERRYRTFRTVERSPETFPRVSYYGARDPKDVVVWCSNDYLGMGMHPQVIGAMHEALDNFGAGAGGTRNISGTHSAIVELENVLAETVGKERALVFSSGYVANQTALSALCRGIPNAIFLSDEMNHDSIIQGLRLGRGEKIVFPHNSAEQLDRILSELPPERPKIIIFESVYSMEGSFGAIPEICEVARKYGAFTFLDETHAVGLYGHRGGGVAQLLELTDQIDVIQGGLGKGFGVVGGFVAGSAQFIDFVRSTGNGFIFTTTLPPTVAAGATASAKILQHGNELREQLQERAMQVKCALAQVRIPMLDTPTHIIPVMVGDATRCKEIADTLLEEFGIYIQPINFPTVPRGTERLRITPTPFHTPAMIAELAEALGTVFDRFAPSRSGGNALIEDVPLYVN
ncbi:MAG: 5-aminolevulinate synthase [Deltaproteobacteria bacterium]|nr:5-aminolevulinate synthase [Deltaproteobacteria bacterium]